MDARWDRFRRWMVGSLVAIFWSGAVFADHESCTRYVVNFGALTVPGEPGEGTSQAEACADAVALWDAWDDSSSDRQARNPSVVGSNCVFEARSCAKSNGACGSWTMPGPYAITTSGTMACPHDPCEEFAGVSTVLNGSGALPATACHAISGQLCQFVPAGVGVSYPGAGKWAARMTPSGESCSLSDDLSAMGDCMMMASGKYACAATAQKKNCGEVNGQQVCLDKVPEGTCMFLADGGMACASDAVPPDSGTPGEPATPDFSFIGDGSGDGPQQVDYYSPGTVAGSSDGGAGRPGVRPGGEGVEGDGDDEYSEGDAGEICEGGDCYGSLPLEIEECADDFDGCVTGFAATLWDTVGDLPMMEFIANFHEAFATSGGCPVVEMTMLGETYDLMEPVCVIVEEHEGLIHLLFQICWSLAGLRVILEA